jgi:ATP-dependent RNA helicase DDX47/RRP3
MSLVKRRKVDTDVPSGLLKKSKKPVVGEAPASAASTSSEADGPEEPDEHIEEEATKTFKDLVSISNIESSKYMLTKI